MHHPHSCPSRLHLHHLLLLHHARLVSSGSQARHVGHEHRHTALARADHHMRPGFHHSPQQADGSGQGLLFELALPGNLRPGFGVEPEPAVWIQGIRVRVLGHVEGEFGAGVLSAECHPQGLQPLARLGGLKVRNKQNPHPSPGRS